MLSHRPPQDGLGWSVARKVGAVMTGNRGVVSWIPAAGAILLLAWGCEFRHPQVQAVPVATQGAVRGAVKVHLIDGSAVLFAASASFSPDVVTGQGRRFDLQGRDVGLVSSVPTDSVAAVVVFTTDYEVGKSVGVSLGLLLLTVTVLSLLSGNAPFGSR
jgi:hypothetical protein